MEIAHKCGKTSILVPLGASVEIGTEPSILQKLLFHRRLPKQFTISSFMYIMLFTNKESLNVAIALPKWCLRFCIQYILLADSLYLYHYKDQHDVHEIVSLADYVPNCTTNFWRKCG